MKYEKPEMEVIFLKTVRTDDIVINSAADIKDNNVGFQDPW